ncbi:MAG TPA: tripartite tricarboxylate transporter substrate-binding protein [Xanthobacteraceae bacterium]|jgi:tripartite-type tricarboxylate transporter receptor subunit TctC
MAGFIGVALLAGGGADAQMAKEAYPNRPVRMIVPFGAGGPGDVFARLIAQKLSAQLGRQFFVENRAGAGGNMGAGLAARAPADGYTLLVGSSTVWINTSLYSQMPYDPVNDLDPVIIAATSPEVLVVHPSVPAKTVQELIALVRAGTYNNFAIPGAGTSPHLSTELFKLSLKLDFATVPFGGGGPMLQSVIAGHTPVAFSALPAAAPQIKEGLLRALAVTSGKRVSILPDVPTMAEAGVGGQEQEAPQCLWAPAGTPREIVDLLYREIARAVATPELKQKMTAIGFEPAAVPPGEFAAYIKADMPKWAALIRAAKIRPFD